jgi:hypothetical protein
MIAKVSQWSPRVFNFTTEHTEGTEKKGKFSPADIADLPRRHLSRCLCFHNSDIWIVWDKSHIVAKFW